MVALGVGGIVGTPPELMRCRHRTSKEDAIMNRFAALRPFCSIALCLGAIAFGSAIKLPALAADSFERYMVPLTSGTCSGSAACLQETNTKTGPGVKGISSAGNGSIGQTKFKSTSPNNGKAGILGQDISTSGGFDSGVLGTSTNGIGVQGTSVNGYGVVARSTNQSALFVENSGAADGIQVVALGNDGTNSSTQNNSSTNPGRSGVWGHDDSTDGGTLNVGVAGSSTYGTGIGGSSTNGFGVSGASTNNDGILGTSTNGYGVVATSTNSVGFYSSGGTASVDAVSPAGDGLQTLQVIGGTTDAPGYNVSTFKNDGTFAFGVDNSGNAHVAGLIYTHGSCSGGCSRTRHDSIVSYAAQSSEPILEDIGEGQLQNGIARVRFDAAFSSATNRNARYVVFVSPEGETKGLYVTAKTSEGFTVVEIAGGHSTIPFGYRIAAKPYGVNAARLPMVYGGQMPKPILAHRHK
jgi:hypothetical protein